MNKTRHRYKRNVSQELPTSIQEYCKVLYLKGCSDNTVTHYRCHINRLAKYSGVDPKDLTIDHFSAYLYDVVFERDYSSDYINQLISASYIYFEYIQNVKFNKEIYARRKKTNKLHYYLTYDEFVSIGKQVKKFRTKVVMWLCYDAGLRIQEALNLKLDNLNFENKTIEIIDSKNNKSRFAKMSDMIEKYLTKYINNYRNLENRPIQNPYLFRGYSDDNPVEASCVEQIFGKAVKDAGLGGHGITLHTLRHAYVTMLYERGVAPDHIQKILGHSSITTTMNYIVQSPSFLADLPSHLSPKVKK